MNKPEIYMHSFSSKRDICGGFGIPENTLDNCHVYLAYYHVGAYGCDSSAFVLYEDAEGQLFEVNGYHCSCYGLEGDLYNGETTTQWYPEQVCYEALLHRATEGSLGSVGGYDDEGYEKESKIVLNYLSQLNKKEI